MDISAKIKQIRKEKNLTADYVAKEIGVAKSTLYRYENGDIDKMPIQILAKIAKIYDTSPITLIGCDKIDDYKTTKVIIDKEEYLLTEKDANEVLLFIQFLLSKQNKPK